MLLLAPGRVSMTNGWRVDPTTAGPAAVPRCRARCRAENRRECAPAAWDRLARKQSARQLAARRRPRPDARICGGEVSLNHLVGAAEQRELDSDAERLRSLEVDDQLHL